MGLHGQVLLNRKLNENSKSYWTFEEEKKNLNAENISMVDNMYPLSPKPTPTSTSFAHCKIQRLLSGLTPTCWAVAKLQPFSGRSEGLAEAGDLGLDPDGKREMRPPGQEPL